MRRPGFSDLTDLAVVAVVAVVTGLGALLACGPPAAVTPARPVAPVSASSPGSSIDFLAAFDDSYRNIMVVTDPLPHIQRWLGSARLARALAREEVVRLGSASEVSIEPEYWRKVIEENQKWIPQGAAIGFSTASMVAFARLARTAYLAALCDTAAEVGTGRASPEWKKLQALVAEQAGKLEMPSLVAWARFRDAEQADSLLTQAGVLLTQILAGAVEVDARPRVVEIDIHLGELMPAETLAGVLAELGLGTGGEDGSGDVLASTLARLRLRMRLVRKGAELHLFLGGELPKPGGRPRIRPPASNPDLLAWLIWDIGALRRETRVWREELHEWLGTPVGASLMAKDDEDLLGDLLKQAGELERASESGEGLIEIAGELRISTTERGSQPATALGQLGILDRIPRDVAGISVSATDSLADYLDTALDSVEKRLAKLSLKEVVAAEEGLYTAASEAYYRRFARFRALVRDKAPRAFSQPAAWIVDTRGRVQRLRVQRGSRQENELSWADLPIAEVAFISKVAAGTDVDALVRTLYTELVTAMMPSRRNQGQNSAKKGATKGATKGQQRPPEADLLPSVDLGLGVPTHTFSGDWLRPALDVALAVEGDLRLHYFTVADLVVFSTSPRLSRAILASTDRAAEIPAQAIGYSRISGKAFVGVIRSMDAWWSAMVPNDTETAEAMRGVAALVEELIGVVTWEVHDQGRERKGIFRVAPPRQN